MSEENEKGDRGANCKPVVLFPLLQENTDLKEGAVLRAVGKRIPDIRTRKQGKANPNQTKPLYYRLPLLLLFLLSGWLPWLAPPAHPAVDGTAEEPNGSGTEEEQQQQQEQQEQQQQQIS
ncbi:unnamed protein product [Sphagnum tenellum]